MRRPILLAPDPVLRQVARPVEVFDDALRQLGADMVETMAAASGVGLAAPQVGVSLRLLVCQVFSSPLVMANPEIVRRGGHGHVEEGCLSLPGISRKVPGRAHWVEVVYQDLDGTRRKMRLDGRAATCLQHERDHLLGVLLTDPRPAP